VRTIIETRLFTAKASKIWTVDQHQDFVVYIAANPEAGAVVPGSGGVRKVRWSKSGSGKNGGVRVIYFNASLETLWLLTLYVKNERETLAPHELKRIKEAIND
jgi:hypothetical protein